VQWIIIYKKQLCRSELLVIFTGFVSCKIRFVLYTMFKIIIIILVFVMLLS